MASALLPTLLVTSSLTTLLARTSSHRFAASGKVCDFDHDLVVLGILGSGGLRMIERELEPFAADQLAVTDPFVTGADHAVGDLEVLFLGVEALGRLLEQRGLRGRRGVAQLHAADLNRQAAPGGALIGRERSVALDELDPVERHVELVGNDLRQRGRDTGAEIDLAAIERHLAAGIDREEGIDLGERERFGPLSQRLADVAGEGKADDERAAAHEHVASRSVYGHDSLPHAPAARMTALTMRACVPQRHRLLASASLTCASVGFLVLARNAADSMIMPLMQ